MKKFIIYLVIFSFFMFSSAKESYANPAVIVAGGIALGTMLFVAGAVKYSAPVLPSSNYFSTLGSVGRLGVATWSIANSYGTETIQNKVIALKVAYDQLINDVVTPFQGNPESALYPGLYNHLTKITQPPPPSAGTTAGSVVSSPTGNKHVDSVNSGSNTSENASGSTVYAGNIIYVYYGGPVYEGATRAAFQKILYCSDITLLPLPRPFADVISENEILPLPTQFQNVFSGEIDDYIRDKPNSWSVQDTMSPDTDIDTAPPFVPPATVIAPGSTVTAPPTVGVVGQSAVTNAQTRLAEATDALRNHEIANPTDTRANSPTLASLQDAVASAQAGVVSTAAGAAVVPAVADSTATPPPLPPRKPLDFTPLIGLVGILSTTYPFNLPLVISGYYQQLSVPGAAPVFTIPMSFGQTIVADLSFFDPIAILLRYMIGILVTVGLLYYIIHFFRGIS